MDKKSRIVLDLIQADNRISWVRDQLTASFAEGIAQSAGVLNVPEVASIYQLAATDVTPRERVKREKYETSRPYEESEKIELLAYALHEVFVTIPAVTLSALHSLNTLCDRTFEIEFSPPDDENAESTPSHSIHMDPSLVEEFARRFEEFQAKLRS